MNSEETSMDISRRVWEIAAELAGLSVDQLEPGSTLESLGLSSTDAVILAMEIEHAIGRSVDVGIFLRFETLQEAADEVVRLVGQTNNPSS